MLKFVNFCLAICIYVMNSNAAFAQSDCASIRDSLMMLQCFVEQRASSTKHNTKNAETINFGTTPGIKDWVKFGSIAGGRADFYYSPSSAKYREISDSQSATGTSRVVVINTMQNFKSRQGTGKDAVSSNVITAIYHCDFPNMKEMKYEAHSGKMGSGKIVSTNNKPSDTKWDSLSEGDDVVIKFVRDICPAIGPKSPKGPLVVVFECTDQAPNVASFKAENILKQVINYGINSAVAMMESYGGCFAKGGSVNNSELLTNAKLVGTKNEKGYYVIDASQITSFGVVGN